MPGSALIVNNRVMLAGGAHHAAIGSSRLLYIATRPGAVTLKTEDDCRIERENALMAKLGYIGFRPGSVAERNSGHALFDASGVPARATVQKELLSTNSAIITSVLSVRREDAEAMRLTTKQDWERFVRSQWPRYIEQLNVIAPENLRWVAAMHICDHSYHVHIFTWDKSGRFNSLLPRQKMTDADNTIRQAALAPQREAPNLERRLARDELIAGIKEAFAANESLRTAVKQALPNRGSLKYASIAKYNPCAKRTVDEAVERALAANPGLSAKRDSFLEAAREHARLKELTGLAYAAHMAAAENDLRMRLGNAAIAAVKAKKLEATPSPYPTKPLTDSEYNPPLERKRLRAMTEEVTSFLSAEEQLLLKEALFNACELEAKPDAESIRAARKLPTLRTRAKAAKRPFGTTFHMSVASNSRRIARVLSSESKRRKGDYGDEAGKQVAQGSIKSLSRALCFLAHSPALTAPSRALKNAASNTLKKG